MIKYNDTCICHPYIIDHIYSIEPENSSRIELAIESITTVIKDKQMKNVVCIFLSDGGYVEECGEQLNLHINNFQEYVSTNNIDVVIHAIAFGEHDFEMMHQLRYLGTQSGIYHWINDAKEQDWVSTFFKYISSKGPYSAKLMFNDGTIVPVKYLEDRVHNSFYGTFSMSKTPSFTLTEESALIDRII